MLRDLIVIDEEKCDGCGLCITACHEGALQMVHGKAKLISESYCDGLGDCLPECPTGAITIEKREAKEYDEAEVKRRIAVKGAPEPPACSCPSTISRSINKETENIQTQKYVDGGSQLTQWPCQLKLVPVDAPYFQNARLLIAADCTAFAYSNVHQRFMKNKVTLIGCPKLDSGNYAEKLSAILANNSIQSISILKMSVPCCGGIVHSVKQALISSGKMIPWDVTTLTPEGQIIE